MTIIDIKDYFSKDLDNRNSDRTFNWQIFELLKFFDIFSNDENALLNKYSDEFRIHKKDLSETIKQKEIERVTIELSWKSSKIEGNTYSLLETENLLKNGLVANERSEYETQMILNHKKAIDLIFSSPQEFKILSLPKIRHIHTLLTEKLNIQNDLRKTLVGITGTTYKPLDNEYQIKEALENAISLINNTSNIFIKSLLAILLVSYIQPFEDGNKRTSRIIGNAILLAYNLFPLSFRNVDEIKYKETVLLFYEQNNLSAFKEICLEQCEFSVQNYFRSKN